MSLATKWNKVSRELPKPRKTLTQKLLTKTPWVFFSIMLALVLLTVFVFFSILRYTLPYTEYISLTNLRNLVVLIPIELLIPFALLVVGWFRFTSRQSIFHSHYFNSRRRIVSAATLVLLFAIPGLIAYQLPQNNTVDTVFSAPYRSTLAEALDEEMLEEGEFYGEFSELVATETLRDGTVHHHAHVHFMNHNHTFVMGEGAENLEPGNKIWIKFHKNKSTYEVDDMGVIE